MDPQCLCMHTHAATNIHIHTHFSSVQFSCQLCPNLCDCMDHSMPGLPVHHQIPEYTKTQVHWAGDATQWSHPLLSPSHTAFNLSQHQGLFKWVRSSHQVAKLLKFQLQHKSFQWVFRTDLFEDGLVGSPFSQKDFQEFYPKDFKSISSSALNFLYSPTLTSIHDYWKNHSLTRWTFVGKIMSLLFNMLSRIVKYLLPKSKWVLISWL